MYQDSYDIIPQERPKKIGGVDYILREATGEAAVKFANAKLNRLSFNDAGKPSTFKNLADVEPYLVSLCLFKEHPKTPGIFSVPVPEADIRAWPQRIQKALFNEAKEISEIDQDETEESLTKLISDAQARLEILKKGSAPKNEQSEAEDGSA